MRRLETIRSEVRAKISSVGLILLGGSTLVPGQVNHHQLIHKLHFYDLVGPLEEENELTDVLSAASTSTGPLMLMLFRLRDTQTHRSTSRKHRTFPCCGIRFPSAAEQNTTAIIFFHQANPTTLTPVLSDFQSLSAADKPLLPSLPLLGQHH